MLMNELAVEVVAAIVATIAVRLAATEKSISSSFHDSFPSYIEVTLTITRRTATFTPRTKDVTLES
jgi:hypothetical protein